MFVLITCRSGGERDYQSERQPLGIRATFGNIILIRKYVVIVVVDESFRRNMSFLIFLGYRQIVHETSQSSSKYAEKSPAMVRLLVEPVMTTIIHHI